MNKSQRIPKGQSKMDNPEKMATQGTQDEDKENKSTTQYVLDTTIRKQNTNNINKTWMFHFYLFFKHNVLQHFFTNMMHQYLVLYK